MDLNMEIKCTGNNGNGCFMDSCGHDCGCDGIMGTQKMKKEYKDLTEEEKLILKSRRADSWKYTTYKLWEQIWK